MKIGFIGLGNLGKAMAQRLISEGTELIVWNRTKEKADGLHAEWGNNPAAVISKSQILFINLFDSLAVQSVMTGPDGLLEGDCNGKIIVDTSTNHFESVISFAEMARSKGASYLESPVMGSVAPALLGNLVLLVSGEKKTFETGRPYLEKIGKKIFYLEKPGLATKMKLINNLCLGTFMASIAEALAFGEDVGVDKTMILDILANGAGNSMILNAKRDKLLNEDFAPQFSSAMIYKDLHYLQDLSRSLKRPLFTGSVVKELFGAAFSRNIENLDISGIYKIMKEF